MPRPVTCLHPETPEPRPRADCTDQRTIRGTVDPTTTSESLQSSVPIKMFFFNINLLYSFLLNVKLHTVFIIMNYLIIAKRHPDELMSKSISLRFYIFMQKMHFFGTLFWLKKHEVYKPAKSCVIAPWILQTSLL